MIQHFQSGFASAPSVILRRGAGKCKMYLDICVTANGDSSVLLLLLWEKEGTSQSGVSFFLSWALNPDSTVPNCLCALLITDAGAFAEKDKAQRAAGRLYKQHC